jgi:hypothetical protein
MVGVEALVEEDVWLDAAGGHGHAKQHGGEQAQGCGKPHRRAGPRGTGLKPFLAGRRRCPVRTSRDTAAIAKRLAWAGRGLASGKTSRTSTLPSEIGERGAPARSRAP